MKKKQQDTIVAIATAPGSGARGIVRLSGPQTGAILTQIFQLAQGETFPARAARRVCGTLELHSPDRALAVPAQVYTWPTNSSYTGEPLAEFHLTGSPPVLNMAVRKICDAGARHAEPGEFTMRSFLNGRINLLQAEAVLGVIDAQRPEQLTTALAQLAGGMSGQMQDLREELLLHLADLEAGLDFVDEDIEFVSRGALIERLSDAVEILTRLSAQSSSRLLATGARNVVLAGLPNAGKSTLLNALVGSEAAIVSPQAGTTRDFVRATMRLHDLQIELLDTAGWEQDRIGIEALVQSQRLAQIRQADLMVWCSAADRSPAERQLDDELFHSQALLSIPVLRVITKGDLLPWGPFSQHSDAIVVCAHRQQGLEQLQQCLYAMLTDHADDRCELISSTAVRCQQSLALALASAALGLQLAKEHGGDELIALEIREVLNHLGQILGAVYTDDILDRIFSRFCIGK